MSYWRITLFTCPLTGLILFCFTHVSFSANLLLTPLLPYKCNTQSSALDVAMFQFHTIQISELRYNEISKTHDSEHLFEVFLNLK